jgi:flavorubredoxin
MTNVLIIYDSKTGNTETMAKAINAGAHSIKDITVEMIKLGTPFPISMLNEVDAIILGSPTHYAYVTVEMRNFLEAIKDLTESGKLKLKNKIGAVFGSYGWDGGWNFQKLELEMKDLGLTIENPIVESVDAPNERVLMACEQLGKNIAKKVLGQH